MACRITQGGRVEMAVFADIDEVKGTCARQLERINDMLIPQGVHLCRTDFRFWGLAPTGGKIKKMVQDDEKPLDDKAKKILLTHYTLPYAAIQGLCLTANQELCILDSEPVNERLGPHARNHDGGAMTTNGTHVDGSPLGQYPSFVCNVTKDVLPLIGQPFRKLMTLCSDDGEIYPNCVHSLIFGSGVFYFELPAGLTRIDLQCDFTTGWRLVHRGFTPLAYQIRPGMKMLTQVNGPEKWKTSTYDEKDMFADAEVFEDV